MIFSTLIAIGVGGFSAFNYVYLVSGSKKEEGSAVATVFVIISAIMFLFAVVVIMIVCKTLLLEGSVEVVGVTNNRMKRGKELGR